MKRAATIRHACPLAGVSAAVGSRWTRGGHDHFQVGLLRAAGRRFDVMADHGDDQGDKAAAAKTPVS